MILSWWKTEGCFPLGIRPKPLVCYIVNQKLCLFLSMISDVINVCTLTIDGDKGNGCLAADDHVRKKFKET